MNDPDELDQILDKIKNRWQTDLTRSLWDDTWMIEETEDETTSERDVPKRANRSRKKHKGNRRRK